MAKGVPNTEILTRVIQQAMAPPLMRLDALECTAMPPPPLPPQPHPSTRGKPPPASGTNMPSSREDGLVATPAEGQNNRPTPTLAAAPPERLRDPQFTLVTRSNRSRSKQRPGNPAANEAATAQS